MTRLKREVLFINSDQPFARDLEVTYKGHPLNVVTSMTLRLVVDDRVQLTQGTHDLLKDYKMVKDGDNTS